MLLTILWLVGHIPGELYGSHEFYVHVQILETGPAEVKLCAKVVYSAPNLFYVLFLRANVAFECLYFS